MDKIIVLDFGGQYCHLISRRIRELGIYSEVLPNTTTAKNLKNVDSLKGLILSGGAACVYEADSPKLDKEILDIEIPILGICYGHQLIASLLGGEVITGKIAEYGVTSLKIEKDSLLFEDIENKINVWMNHRDIVSTLPRDFSIIASTNSSKIAVYENKNKKIYGIQFHPEVSHTEKGTKILENFAFQICKAKMEWSTRNIVETIIAETKEKIGNKRAIIGLSGGIDSSTAAILVDQAIGKNLVAVYVDTGLMRYKETEFIKNIFSNLDLNLKIVYAGDRFFKALKGISEPEDKRKIIGKLFVEVFDEIAKLENCDFLIQGTIYSDRIESGITKNSSKIKSHHNVGGLPENMKLSVYEPLRELYKDEVREIAKEVRLPKELIERQVFPGPGLAVRIIGEVNPEKAEIVRKSSCIIEEELKQAGIYNQVWMSFAVLLPIKSVGIQGDARSYKYPIVVRIIESKDAMTANFSKIPYEVLEKISTRITNEVSEVNRVVYDISNKPPATMEWE